MRRLLAALLILVAAGCHQSDGWARLPASPLGGRHGAVAVGLPDGELLVVGGWSRSWCPGNADCDTPHPPERTGAVLDVDSGRWRSIADAPVPVAGGSPVVVDGRVFLHQPGVGWNGDPQPADAFLSYDLAADRWQALALPPNGPFLRLAPTDRGTIVAARTTEEHGERGDALYDPSTGAWTELPVPPRTPGFDRSIVPVGDRLVLLDLGIDDDRRPWPPYRVTTFHLGTQRWTRRADSPVRGTAPEWHRAGDLVVNAAVDEQNRIGGIYDPAANRWEELPRRGEGGDGPRYVTAGDGVVTSAIGWALDVDARHWVDVPALDAPRSASVTWADGGLVVFGGERFADPERVGTPVADGWIWRPPAVD